MPRILLIDDDEHLAQPLATYFARFGYVLEAALRPSEGLARLRAGHFDAAILDVMLPEMDGFALCREIRRLSDIPVVMLTARGEVTDRVVGLELGADDYLPKPFDPRELVARVQTILRRPRTSAAGGGMGRDTGIGLAVGRAGVAAAPRRLAFDGLTIDLDRREAVRTGNVRIGVDASVDANLDASIGASDGSDRNRNSTNRNYAHVELTGSEFELLALLASQPGRVFSRDDILNRLRGIDAAAELTTRAVDIVVSRLRKKLEPLDDAVKTLRNAGYALGLAPLAPPQPPSPSAGSTLLPPQA